MSDIKLNKAFRFPISWLLRYAPRFTGALADPEMGPDVLAHLPQTFPQDLDAQIELLERLGVDQSHASGHAGEVTLNQGDAIATIDLLCGSARNAAKVVFARNKVVQHDEFFVGQHSPRNLPTLLRRAELILAACQARQEALSTHGWSADQTKALADAIAAAQTANEVQHATTDQKEGYTAEQVVAANALYRMLRAIQNVARAVYPVTLAKTDPSVVGKRAKFLLGEFPPWGATRADDETPGGTTPVSNPGGSPAPSTPGGSAAGAGTPAA